ncbi:MAG: DUF2470 domain-containing protein [Pseudomonadota bacterium]
MFQPIDDAARRLAFNLLRRERHAALATLEPLTGAPMVSRVNFATTMDGRGLFLISQLSDHFGALEHDQRASLMVGAPGSGDPLRHPRLMLSGQAEQLVGAEREQALFRFLNRHEGARIYAGFADFALWVLTPEKATLNGGFAKAYRLSANDLISVPPEGLAQTEMGAVEHMNEDHLDAIKFYAENLLSAPEGNWRISSFDHEGLDLISGDMVERLWFETPLAMATHLRPELVKLAKRARGQ